LEFLEREKDHCFSRERKRKIDFFCVRTIYPKVERKIWEEILKKVYLCLVDVSTPKLWYSKNAKKKTSYA